MSGLNSGRGLKMRIFSMNEEGFSNSTVLEGNTLKVAELQIGNKSCACCYTTPQEEVRSKVSKGHSMLAQGWKLPAAENFFTSSSFSLFPDLFLIRALGGGKVSGKGNLFFSSVMDESSGESVGEKG